MPGGRPTKFTPDRQKKLLEALRAGNYRETACKYAGISHTTLRNWLLKAEGPDADPEYVEFLAALEKAEADAEVTDIALIRQAAADGSWQAAAWVRERKNPERWGRRDRTAVELSGAGGGPLELSVAQQVDATAIAGLLAALQSRAEQGALSGGHDVLDVDPVD